MKSARPSFIWQLLLLLPLTFLLVAMFPGCQAELAKWEFARGLIELEDGKTESAIARMMAAVEQSPSDDGLKLALSVHLSEQGEREALRLCDEVLEKYPGNQAVIFNKSICQHNLGDFEDGLATYKLLLSDHVGRDIVELNNLAYFRGLAGKELMLAAENIKVAVDAEEQNGWPSGRFLPMTIRAALAIGLLSRRVECQESAIGVLSSHVEALESDCEKLDSIISLIAFSPVQNQLEPDQQLSGEAELYRKRLEVTQSVLASVLTVRALINQDLGQEQECNADRYRVKELGFDADQIAKKLPSEMACFEDLKTAIMLLDTRGFVFALLPFSEDQATPEERAYPMFRTSSYREAMKNLDAAVMSAEYARRVLQSQLFNTPMYSAKEVGDMLARTTRSEAVLLNHRVQLNQLMMARSATENATNEEGVASETDIATWEKEIEVDQARIKALGFIPDSSLF